MSRARDVVQVVARALAASPDEVNVTEHERRGMTVVELTMAPGELGRVIGRQGRTAAALRTLASAAGELDGLRVSVDFLDQAPFVTAPAWESMVLVGRIVRPHGNRGNVVVHPETDFGDERFRPGARLFLQRDGAPVAVEVTGSREHDGRWVVGFSGVTTIDGAETLRDHELRIPEDWLLPAGDGRYYVHDLIGCTVETVAGDRIGQVLRVDLLTGIPLLVFERNGDEVLIPFTDAICTTVDLPGKRVVIEPPAGLLELNVRRTRDDD